jgi:hypothetical protein
MGPTDAGWSTLMPKIAYSICTSRLGFSQGCVCLSVECFIDVAIPTCVIFQYFQVSTGIRTLPARKLCRVYLCTGASHHNAQLSKLRNKQVRKLGDQTFSTSNVHKKIQRESKPNWIGLLSEKFRININITRSTDYQYKVAVGQSLVTSCSLESASGGRYRQCVITAKTKNANNIRTLWDRKENMYCILNAKKSWWSFCRIVTSHLVCGAT